MTERVWVTIILTAYVMTHATRLFYHTQHLSRIWVKKIKKSGSSFFYLHNEWHKQSHHESFNVSLKHEQNICWFRMMLKKPRSVQSYFKGRHCTFGEIYIFCSSGLFYRFNIFVSHLNRFASPYIPTIVNCFRFNQIRKN